MKNIAIYVKENNKATNMFVNVNGSKNKIISGWVHDTNTPRMVFSSDYIVNGVKIVSWTDGTDEEVAAMLDAHYDDRINIYNYWHVGDERKVHFNLIPEETPFGYNGKSEKQPEQDISFIIMHCGGMKLSEPLNGKTTCAFIIGQKNCLQNSGMLHTTNSSVLLDKNRIQWLNSLYKESLPPTFQALFKKHYKYGACFEGGSHKMYQYTNFLFWLPSEFNILGTTIHSSSLEKLYQFQFEYYKDEKNIRKMIGVYYDEYWTSSIAYDIDKYKKGNCSILANGEPSYKQDTKYCGIAPYGCI